jgi:hypothetical protein
MNHFPRLLRSWTAALVIAALCVIQAAPAAAGLSPSQVSGTTSITSARDADMVVAQRGLEHRVVAQKLRDYGVTPEAAQARLADMSDRDLHTRQASRGLPTGGDGTGALIGVLIVVVLVIVILKLTNHDVIVR